MKKIICLVLAIVLCLSLLPLGVYAEPANGYYTGPGVVQAGDTITLTFGVGGTNIYGVEGTLSYDSAMLTLLSTSALIGGNWRVEFNGNRFVAYDDYQTEPINGSADIFCVSFKVNESLTAGTRISASCVEVIASGKQTGESISATYSTVLVQPTEENLDLQSLVVSNGTLSPAFRSDVTDYTATIPHDSSRANITAVPADSDATVQISNTSVEAGQTKQITVTVTGDSGNTKVYTISVTRDRIPQDDPVPTEPGPNVPTEPTEPADPTEPIEPTDPSEEGTTPTEGEEATQPDGEKGGSDLKIIQVNGGKLEPAFNSNITEYTVVADGALALSDIFVEAVDPEAKIQVEKEGTDKENTDRFVITVSGTDGSAKTYTITAQQKQATETSGKCGFGCPCMWLWIVTMVLLVIVVIVMFVLYKKARGQK